MIETKRENVSIVGCGWLGLPLALHLQREGYNILGTKTTGQGVAEIRKQGVRCFLFSLKPQPVGENLGEIFASDWIVINIPPERRTDVGTFHLKQMKNIFELAKKGNVKKILFVSSTSVYPSLNREVSELDDFMPEKESGKVLKKIESLFINAPFLQSTVIRFGGLIGGNRMPGRFLAGKNNLKNGNAPVNLIHLDDCVEIIGRILKENILGEVFNACSPQHPLRKDFYREAAIKENFEVPNFLVDDVPKYKIVNSEKLINRLGYSFIYANPLDAL